MDKELAQGPIGSVGSYDISFKGGKLILVAKGNIPPSEMFNFEIQIDAAKVLDAMKEAIPGKLDDLAIGLLKSALGL